MSWDKETKEERELPLKEFISTSKVSPELDKAPESNSPVLSTLPLIFMISLLIALLTVEFNEFI